LHPWGLAGQYAGSARPGARVVNEIVFVYILN